MASKVHVKREDTVMVISGKDTGKSGKVIKVDTEKGRVFVSGVNIVTKHRKARGQNEPASIVETEGSVDASNVMLVCPSCKLPTRVAHVVNADGSKDRVCKNKDCKAVISNIKKAAKEG